jgi:hypothetical protein
MKKICKNDGILLEAASCCNGSRIAGSKPGTFLAVPALPRSFLFQLNYWIVQNFTAWLHKKNRFFQ